MRDAYLKYEKTFIFACLLWKKEKQTLLYCNNMSYMYYSAVTTRGLLILYPLLNYFITQREESRGYYW